MEGGLNDAEIKFEAYDVDNESGDIHLVLTASDEDENDINVDDNQMYTISPQYIDSGFTLADDNQDVHLKIIKNINVLHQLQKITNRNLNISHLGDIKSGWTKPMVKCLINCYRELILEFRDPLRKQKHVWMKAAELMMKNNFDVTWSQCDRKWRNLKHTFKKYYYSKKKDKKIQWEFYDDLVILFAPDCRDEFRGKQRMSRILFPPSEAFLSDSVSMEESIPSTSETFIPSDTIIVDDGMKDFEFEETIETRVEDEVETRMEKMNNKTDQPPSWFVDYMKQFEERQEKRLEEIRTMHEQTLDIERQKFLALQELLNQITYKENEIQVSPTVRDPSLSL